MAFFEVSFFSSVLGMFTNMNVVLPQTMRGMIGVDASDAPVRIPVLYLLHGMSDDHTIWSRRTSVERYAEEAGIAVVMPTTGLGWYTDMAHGLRWRTYVGEELPRICHDFFPQLSSLREENCIAGLSMGGYGAYAIGLTYPLTFGAAAGLSGAYTPFRLHRTEQTFWTDIFGDPDAYRDGPNDLFSLAAKRLRDNSPLPRLYMWCGTEDAIYDQSAAMRDHLQKFNWPDFTYEESAGAHNWACWDEKIRTVIHWMRQP